MKNAIILFTLILCSCVSLNAQETKTRSSNEIDISYYNTHIGQNIAAEYNRNFGKHTLVLGIKYHLNRYVGISENLSNNYVYRKHFYARKFPEHFGFTLGYEYHLKAINPYVSPYLLYNCQFSRMPTKHIRAQETASSNYRYNQVYNGPFIAIENTIGGGLAVKLCDWLSLNQSVGLQVPFIYEQAPLYNRSAWTWDGFDLQWRAGLTVSL